MEASTSHGRPMVRVEAHGVVLQRSVQSGSGRRRLGSPSGRPLRSTAVGPKPRVEAGGLSSGRGTPKALARRDVSRETRLARSRKRAPRRRKRQVSARLQNTGVPSCEPVGREPEMLELTLVSVIQADH